VGPREIRARFPAGVKDGGQIRLRGQGINGGDLVVKIRVGDHPLLKREGDDLLLNLPITIGEAYKGAKIPVPTLDGDVTLTVPKRASSGMKLRLRGKGVKSGDHVGDMIVTLLIRLPESEEDEVGEWIDSLEKKYAKNPRGDIKL
jgi:curved DNA-binding protein